MLKSISLSVLTLLLTSSSVVACNCLGQTTSFSLHQYDVSHDVIEVEFFNFFEDPDHKRYKDSMQLVWAEWQTPGTSMITHPAPLPLSEYVYVEGIVLKSYKGELVRDTTLFLTTAREASCVWLPTLGERYILYLEKPYDHKGNEVLGLGKCQRQVGESGQSSELYQSERSVLKTLSRTKSGRFTAQQEFKEEEFTGEISPFDGGFKRGLRHGAWTVNLPLYRWHKDFVPNKPGIVIIYDMGKVISVTSIASELNNRRFLGYHHWPGWYRSEMVRGRN